MERTH
ncbi:rCG54629, partial [Rattus norvegicus]